jgi:hypothetical protein
MAAVIAIRVMEDGPRNTIVFVSGNNGATGVDPGAGGTDLAYQQLILPSQVGYVALNTHQRAAAFRIDCIEWDVQSESQMRVDLFWDATPTPLLAYHCIGRANKFFKNFGGLYAPSTLVGSTGGIGISTIGAPTSYAGWTITLYLVKNGLNPP